MKNKSQYASLIVVTGILAGLATLAVFVFEPALSVLSGLARRFIPFQGPGSRVNEHGATIYAAMGEDPPTVSSGDITYLTLPQDGSVNSVDPFQQLIFFGTTPEFKAVGIALLAVLVALVMVVAVRSVSARLGRAAFPILALSSATTAAFVLLTYVVKSAGAGWDEIYVFASQARNFAQTGIAAVPITGPRALGESSADLSFTIVAGLLFKAFPSLQVETALVGAIVLMMLAICFAMALALHYWFQVNRWASLAIPLFVVFLAPPSLLSSASAMPTGVAAAALALFGLVLLHGLRTDSVRAFAIYAIPFATVRWEYGILAIGGSMLLLAGHVVRRRGGTRPPWGLLRFNLLLVPFLYFGLATVIRMAVFGSWAPSGVLSKNVGIDGAYMASGLDYLAVTNNTNHWIAMLLVAIAAVILTRPFSQSIPFLAVIGLLMAPLGNSIAAGGDWFPSDWQRYVLPSYEGVLIVSFGLLAESVAKRERLKLVAIPVAALFVATQLAFLPIVQQPFVGLESPGRTNCLARAGLAIDRILPDGEGVASPEVNTVAYFAGAEVTDLIGLIDPRVALAPPSPRSLGDSLHRRALPQNIYDDAPGAIYLWEGASCFAPPVSRADDTILWNELLGSEITRFRAGSVDTLLEHYQPVTVRVPGELLLHVLVRTDIVGAL